MISAHSWLRLLKLDLCFTTYIPSNWKEGESLIDPDKDTKGKVSIQSVCIIDDKNMAGAAKTTCTKDCETTCSLAETNTSH